MIIMQDYKDPIVKLLAKSVILISVLLGMMGGLFFGISLPFLLKEESPLLILRWMLAVYFLVTFVIIPMFLKSTSISVDDKKLRNEGALDRYLILYILVFVIFAIISALITVWFV